VLEKTRDLGSEVSHSALMTSQRETKHALHCWQVLFFVQYRCWLWVGWTLLLRNWTGRRRSWISARDRKKFLQIFLRLLLWKKDQII